MNIKRAKEEIEHTVKAYLAKDALGEYAIPSIRQRPILLMGPPGIGKTQVMEQVARECGVALVAYTITHHTRQSAVGLPFIRQRHYGDKDVSVTEYTMSEIIASIYAKMEATGLSEGILFIDEINCVSETLAPTMLQFLQCKTFGNQAVPAGWVIVAAGNPPEYNKSVRDFDIVTLDRVRRMDIEPDLPVWKDYARAAHIHSAILSYLELHPQNFYQINADVDGTQFVTARGWEDLSNLLDTYEALGLQADEELIREYIQHPKIAEDFSAYLDLYYKYRDDYGVEEILAGQAKPAVFARLLQAPFDERLSLVSLLLAGLDTRFTASLQADAVADACYAFLRETKKALATLPEDIPDGSAELFSQQIKDYEAETQQKRDAGLLGRAELTNRLQVQAALHQWEGELRRANAAGTQEAFDLLRGQFRALADQREAAQKTAAAALEAAFDFMEHKPQDRQHTGIRAGGNHHTGGRPFRKHRDTHALLPQGNERDSGLPHMLRGACRSRQADPRLRQRSSGGDGGAHQQPQGARGTPLQSAPAAVPSRRELHQLHKKRQLHAPVARQRLQYARHALPEEAPHRQGRHHRAAHKGEQQVRNVYALHTDLRKGTDREYMGSARHRLAGDG